MAFNIKGPMTGPTVRLEVEGGGSREVSVEPGRSLLSALRRDAALFVPSPCAGRGACGLCKVRILEGGSPLSPIELPWIGDEERERGIHLSCQVRIAGSLTVWIPEGLARARAYRSEVEAIRDYGRGYLLVSARLIEPSEMRFEAGQYIQLEIPSGSEPVYRAYSIASSPSDRGRIELLVREVPNGLAASAVWQGLRPASHLAFSGPHGELALSCEGSRLLFLASGSGVAPIRSMLLSLVDGARGCGGEGSANGGGNLPAIPSIALYLVGVPPHIAEELARLRERLPELRLTELASPGDRLAPLLAADVRANLDCYLCGSPAVVDPGVRVLLQGGVPHERIHVDRFG